MVCSVLNCSCAYYSKSFCKHHYDKNRRHGSPYFQRIIKKDRYCTFIGCKKNQMAKGLCQTHYVKLRRTGTLVYQRIHDDKVKERARAKTAKWKKDNWGYYKAYLNSRKKRIKIYLR